MIYWNFNVFASSAVVAIHLTHHPLRVNTELTIAHNLLLAKSFKFLFSHGVLYIDGVKTTFGFWSFLITFTKESSRFSEELLSEIKKLEPLNKKISIFHNVCIELLEKYALEKQKYIRANQVNFMGSKLNHAFMLRSKLRNKFLKYRSNKDRGLQETTKFMRWSVASE